jgi:group I intron endonuclease
MITAINSGIYMLLNIQNNKFYIGSTINFKRRKSEHFNHLLKQKHKNDYLQNSYNKHGKDNFLFLIIERCRSSELGKREQYYLDTLKPHYNLTTSVIGTIGYSHTEMAKKQMSAIKKEQYNKGLEVWNKGKMWSEEAKNKISNTLKGKYTGVNHPFFGKTHTEENKKLMVEASYRRKGTHHKGRNGRVFQIDKDTLEVLNIFSSARAAATTLIIKGTLKTAGNKISESIKYNRNAYGFKWLFENSLDQIKVDELLETLARNSRQSAAKLSEAERSETT